MRALQEEVIRTNPGKSREQLIAIFQERQKQFGMSLQKQAVDVPRRACLLPQLKKDAKEELIDERLKVQEAKKLGIEVTDDDVKRMLKDFAERNKMTYDQFSQHLKGMGVDIATMGEQVQGAEGLARLDWAPLCCAGLGDAARCRSRALQRRHRGRRGYGRVAGPQDHRSPWPARSIRPP